MSENQKALATRQEHETARLAQQNQSNAEVVALVTKGDLSKLSNEELVRVYIARCDALGLDVRATPFELINFKGKTQLYPKKEAAEQLRRINGISTKIVEEVITEQGILRVRIEGRDKLGREDEEVAALFVKGMSGQDLADAMMKVITKAKRRLTLSMCGLGQMADIDDDDPRILRRQALNMETGELIEIVDDDRDEQKRVDELARLHAAGADVGLDHDQVRSFAQIHFPMIESLTELAADDLTMLADTIKDAVQHSDYVPGEHSEQTSESEALAREVDETPRVRMSDVEEEYLASILASKSTNELVALGEKMGAAGVGNAELRAAYASRLAELADSKPGQRSLINTPAGRAGDDRHSS
jgi:hypothetical protein